MLEHGPSGEFWLQLQEAEQKHVSLQQQLDGYRNVEQEAEHLQQQLRMSLSAASVAEHEVRCILVVCSIEFLVYTGGMMHALNSSSCTD